MNEGWNDDEYLILFDQAESEQMTEGYGIRQFLPDLIVIGIIHWGEFILRDRASRYYRVPTVPLAQQYVDAIAQIPDASNLVPDERFSGKIKWFVKPIIFGGDPNSEDNAIWVDIQKHQELVQWWNQRYREVAGG